MKKIVYLPLDERPCNLNFPQMLFKCPDFELVAPDISIMGQKKKPAEFSALADYLIRETAGADGLVISLDTLLYGGIVPSRLHNLSVAQIQERLDLLKRLKKDNPKLLIYAFGLIMRCPQYSSDDEEPDYYAHCGREIFLCGESEHKLRLGLTADVQFLDDCRKKAGINLTDYLNRRKINLSTNIMSLEFLKSGVIDFMIVPQDDSAQYGYTAGDQSVVRQYIRDNNLHFDALMYPGADEAGMVLIMRMINSFLDKTPRIYVRYSASAAASTIPLYEDRTLGETVKYQITACGGVMWDNPSDADIVLMINCGAGGMVSAGSDKARNAAYDTERNLTEFCLAARYLQKIKPVMLADVAFCNGGDLELMGILNKNKMLASLASYAGWNTSSNTLGTALAQGLLYLIYGDTPAHRDFLALRYVEDFGYCGYVRKYVCDNDLAALNLNYFNADGQRGKAAEIVKKRLVEFVANNLTELRDNIVIADCYLPWSRMFEAGLKVNMKK